ncbi:MAG TPA: ATP-binding protein, partial [Chthoniobacteraceae bacterium]|nr:ATP-binding protein [Chthoniobacteraceae bacterium]
MPMHFWSLRTRLLLWTATVVAAALIVFGAGSAWNLRNRILALVDRNLRAEAEDFFDSAEANKVDWSDRKQVEYLLDLPRSRRYVLVTRDPKVQLYASANMSAPDSPRPVELGEEKAQTLTFGGEQIRFIVRRENDLVLSLGTTLSNMHGIVHSLLISYAVALPIVLLVIGFGGWWIARQALAPLETIINRAQSITSSKLDERLPTPRTKDEIGRLTLVLNTMFDRLESSFRQVAQFTSDASHELKTPLSIMRAEIERALESGKFNDEQEPVLLSLLEEAAHLSKITSNLLILSQADAGRLELEFRSVDLSLLAADVIEDMEIVAEAREIRIETSWPAGLTVKADPHRVRQVFLNLLDNAIKYNHDGGTVKWTMQPSGASVVVTVANTGRGIPNAHAPQIFRRFFRSNHSVEKAEGYGLGLSICHEIVRMHGGSLELATANEEWTEFRLS